MRRNPVVAGTFYEGTREGLIERLKWCFLHKLGPGKLPKLNVSGPRRLVGIISPHAGYMYSGPIAAHGYSVLAEDGVVDIVVIIGPNHHGMGAPLAVYPRGVWVTPLGEVPVADDVVNKLVKHTGIIEKDTTAHLYEHSLEVQLPFLQYTLGEDFKIVPITMLIQNYDTSVALADALVHTLEGYNHIIIASTDFTHYEPHERAREKDMKAIERIVNLDTKGLYDVIFEMDISMCGYGPVMVLMEYSRKVGARNVNFLKYATSGDITKDYSSVVGYASLVMME
ncbi:MAG: hypothetical protein DRJ49_03640 [Thermoprotei archaeon]|nr:MAG: hypothetical protein DRN53_00215 [Thermoprotei archaeon]RLE89238.1 MAG: hypothetical protein DRJ49_03640 [Thermoprotei archaeon]